MLGIKILTTAFLTTDNVKLQHSLDFKSWSEWGGQLCAVIENAGELENLLCSVTCANIGMRFCCLTESPMLQTPLLQNILWPRSAFVGNWRAKYGRKQEKPFLHQMCS